jgi:hypothetical protein
MTENQFQEVAAWQKQTFPKATSLSKVLHLEKEVIELRNDLIGNYPDKRLEYADCFLLLYGSAASDGMSYQDICDAIAEKMEINKNRKWGKPDENGVGHHVK